MKQRINYLDGLRGVAAIAVLVQHCAEIVIKFGAAPTIVVAVLRALLIDSCNLGRFGVALFFLISGMVIPFSFREPHPLKCFAISRFFRLYPAYWLSIIMALAVYTVVGRSLPSPAMLVANLTMAQRFIGFSDIVDAYWTLAIELAFYLLCAGIYAAGRLHAPRVLAGATLGMLALSVALTIAGVLLQRHFPAGVPLNLSLMFVGTLIRLGWLDGDGSARRFAIVAGLIWLIGVIVVQLLVIPNEEEISAVPRAFLAGYYAAFIVFVVALIRRPQPSPMMLWLGGISYSVYLFHGVMLVAFEPLVTSSTEWNGLAFFLIVLASTVLVSHFVWKLVERPMIRRGHAMMTMITQGIPK